MEYSMYLCPDCKKIYKIHGENKTIMCSACKNALIDLKVPITEWENLSKEARENIKKAACESAVKKATQSSFFSDVPEEIEEKTFDNSTFKSENIHDNNVSAYSMSNKEEQQNKKIDNEIRNKEKQDIDLESNQTKKESLYSTSTKKVFKRNKENTYGFIIYIFAFLIIIGSIIIGFVTGGMPGLLIGASGLVFGILLLGFSEVIGLLQDIKDILLQ